MSERLNTLLGKKKLRPTNKIWVFLFSSTKSHMEIPNWSLKDKGPFSNFYSTFW